MNEGDMDPKKALYHCHQVDHEDTACAMALPQTQVAVRTKSPNMMKVLFTVPLIVIRSLKTPVPTGINVLPCRTGFPVRIILLS